jgi:hypothetical protein
MYACMESAHGVEGGALGQRTQCPHLINRYIFAELKAFIKRSWSAYEEDTAQGFDVFIECCVDQVGSRKRSARGQFRHSVWTIEEL